MIAIPGGGKVKAEFVRDFYANKDNGKVVVTLIGKKGANGMVQVEAGID